MVELWKEPQNKPYTQLTYRVVDRLAKLIVLHTPVCPLALEKDTVSNISLVTTPHRNSTYSVSNGVQPFIKHHIQATPYFINTKPFSEGFGVFIEHLTDVGILSQIMSSPGCMTGKWGPWTDTNLMEPWMSEYFRRGKLSMRFAGVIVVANFFLFNVPVEDLVFFFGGP